MKSRPDPIPIRAARSEEAAALGDLCLRSKAHWGYDADFIERCRAALAVTAEEIVAGRVFVVVDGADRPLGVLKLGPVGVETELDALFIEPAAIGRGIGRVLLNHACRLAAAGGAERLGILADPFAAGFYEAAGAVFVENRPSDAISGRTLPFYRLALVRVSTLGSGCFLA